MRLKGKACLITGGSRGLGEAQARLFAREGARVAIGDVLEARGRGVAEEISDGGDAMFLRLDVSREDDWRTAVDAVEGAYGRLDVLVNNAGIFQRATVEETTAEGWDRVMAVNARGVFLGTREAIPAMRRSGGGSIVNLSSVAGIVGSASTAYAASKGAVRLLTKATAVQYAKEGIRANSVHPGSTATDMLHQVYPTEEELAARGALTPLGRFATPEDIAYGVLYLASDESSFVTGAELVIDGGYIAQ
ncbi:MAG: glucose 1-dehydrogenase [Candidatus Brocadiia bacterium]|nr:glucose 1-dehydrogenase [Candidatus Brocadiia bacterium]